MSMVPIGAAVTDGYNAGHGLPFDSDGMKEDILVFSFLNLLGQS